MKKPWAFVLLGNLRLAENECGSTIFACMGAKYRTALLAPGQNFDLKERKVRVKLKNKVNARLTNFIN